MTLSERIARVQAEPFGACADICRYLGRHSALCPNAPRPPVQSPFTRRALARELPAKGLSR